MLFIIPEYVKFFNIYGLKKLFVKKFWGVFPIMGNTPLSDYVKYLLIVSTLFEVLEEKWY